MAVGLVLWSGAGAPAASGADEPDGADAAAIEWSVAPADSGGPDGRISLRHTLAPGEEADDAIAVTNLAEATTVFAVRTGAGIVGDDGVFDIGDPDPAGAGAWLTVGGLDDAGELALAPGETRVLPVRVSVPARATPGDHPAGIAVGVTQGDGVELTHRIGIRAHLRVSGDIEPALRATVTSARFSPSWWPFAPGRLTVEYELENTGNVRLGATLTATAEGPGGLGRSESPLDPLEELLPGERVDRVATLRAPTLFRLNGTLTMQPVTVGEDDVTPPAATTLVVRLTAVPWTGIALLLALAALAVWGTRRRRRLRRERA
jgi:hypothetical protein